MNRNNATEIQTHNSISVPAAAALTKSELSRRGMLEKSIETGLQTFFEVGAALKEIRDGKLYRDGHRRESHRR